MAPKSFLRYFIFGAALMAVLYFFGVRPQAFSPVEQTVNKQTDSFNILHDSGPLHQPFEIENKEEQISSEDDELGQDHEPGLVADDSSFKKFQAEPADLNDLSEQDAEPSHHTPTYVRLRKILI